MCSYPSAGRQGDNNAALNECDRAQGARVRKLLIHGYPHCLGRDVKRRAWRRSWCITNDGVFNLLGVPGYIGGLLERFIDEGGTVSVPLPKTVWKSAALSHADLIERSEQW